MWQIEEDRLNGTAYIILEGTLEECEDWLDEYTENHPLDTEKCVSKDKTKQNKNGELYEYTLIEVEDEDF